MQLRGVLYFSQTAISSMTEKSQSQHVHIEVVEKVPLYDYSQAQKAWEALVEAGIEPGKLVVEGLESGHNYPVKKLNQKHKAAKSSSNQPVSDSQSSETALVSYTREKQTTQLLIGPQKVKNAQKTLAKTNSVSLYTEEQIEQINLYAVTPENRLESVEDLPLLPASF